MTRLSDEEVSQLTAEQKEDALNLYFDLMLSRTSSRPPDEPHKRIAQEQGPVTPR